MRVLAVLAAGVALQWIAALAVGWYKLADDDLDVTIRPFDGAAPPALNAGSAAYWVALAAFVLLGLRLFAKTLVFGIALAQGHPQVRRGLFDADAAAPARWLRLTTRLQVAWLTPMRAYAHLGLFLAATIALVVIVPGVAWVPLVRGSGGFVMIAGIVATLAAVRLLARDPALAAVQGWAQPQLAAPEPTPPPDVPAPVRRPMIKSPLPSPPSNIDTDPFRAPPAAGDLEQRLVRPVIAGATPLADDPSQPPPRLLC